MMVHLHVFEQSLKAQRMPLCPEAVQEGEEHSSCLSAPSFRDKLLEGTSLVPDPSMSPLNPRCSSRARRMPKAVSCHYALLSVCHICGPVAVVTVRFGGLTAVGVIFVVVFN